MTYDIICYMYHIRVLFYSLHITRVQDKKDKKIMSLEIFYSSLHFGFWKSGAGDHYSIHLW